MKLTVDFHRKVLENFNQGIMIIEKTGEIVFWNKMAETITGYSSEEVMGRNCSNNLLKHFDYSGNSFCEKACPIVKTFIDINSRELSAIIKHKNGKKIPVFINVFPLADEKGEIYGVVESFRVDIEQALNFDEKEIYLHSEILDEYTCLPNRSFIEEKLSVMIKVNSKNENTFGLIMIKIDNDECDFSVGPFFKGLRDKLRSHDVLGKWEEDEYIIILKNIGNSIDLVIGRIEEYAVKFTENGKYDLKSSWFSIAGVENGKSESMENMIDRLEISVRNKKKSASVTE